MIFIYFVIYLSNWRCHPTVKMLPHISEGDDQLDEIFMYYCTQDVLGQQECMPEQPDLT